MHPLNNGSQVENVPTLKPRVGIPGYFSESNDNGAPSYPGQDWFNAVIREFQNALAASGVAFDPNNFDHLQKLLNGAGKNLAESLVGMTSAFHTDQTIPGWVDARGGYISRFGDSLLWNHAQASGLVVSQALKDADPIFYAMHFGDGDGTTNFTLPNHHLGHFIRGYPAGTSLGLIQSDAIRNITGKFEIRKYGPGNSFVVNASDAMSIGVNSGSSDLAHPSSTASSVTTDEVLLDASNIVPTANENRPHTANVSFKIFRGWF
ncbi:hypothetical protein [Vibrio bivalvicida]|uniref:Phage tail protein n=1 Tax=Vibrio bivalvicida TaxID=1276888 RepID=A0ABV4MLJ4_9VIBR